MAAKCDPAQQVVLHRSAAGAAPLLTHGIETAQTAHNPLPALRLNQWLVITSNPLAIGGDPAGVVRSEHRLATRRVVQILAPDGLESLGVI
jgi:hypothetical protein